MRRSRINLLAALVVALGGALLTTSPAQAASCDGPAGEQGCTCSGGGYTCTGDACTSSSTGCNAWDKE